MEKGWILAIAIALFVLITFFTWRLTRSSFKKEVGNTTRHLWRARLYYWQEIIYLSTGITILVLFLLKWAKLIRW